MGRGEGTNLAERRVPRSLHALWRVHSRRMLLVARVPDKDRSLLPFLSAHVRQESERGNTVTLTEQNWRDLASAHQGVPIGRRLEKILEYVAAHSRPGDEVQINLGADYPLFDAVSKEEMTFLVEHLVERSLLRQGEHDGGLILSVAGWGRLEPAGTGGIAGRCFVAMSFDPSISDAYQNGIRPAIEDDCRLTAIRVDLVEHNEKICDRIVAEIKKAQFAVADFTLHRAGVYFEAGFAMGLGRPVIWTCRRDDLTPIRK